MKDEAKLWKKLSKNTPNIMWSRIESWASFGIPYVLGDQDACGVGMGELKIARSR